MTIRDKLKIKFAVEEAGWAKCSVEFDNTIVEMDASDVMNDPLSEMVEAALKLLREKTEANFFVWEEPAECRWYIELKNDKVEMEIVRYSDIMSTTSKQKEELIFHAEVDFIDFIRAVIRCVDDVILTEGEEGYSRKWEEHKLPYNKLETLKSEFRAFNDNRKRREENDAG